MPPGPVSGPDDDPWVEADPGPGTVGRHRSGPGERPGTSWSDEPGAAPAPGDAETVVQRAVEPDATQRIGPPVVDPGGGAAGPENVGRGHGEVVESRQRPRRTLAVVLLDSVLDGVAAIRRLAGRVRAAGMRDERLLRGLAVASAVLVAGTAILLVALLRGPGETGRPRVAPATQPGVVTTAEPVTPGIGVSPAASAPPPVPHQSPAGPPARLTPGTAQSVVSAAVLAARFTVDDKALISYGASVLISNSGAVAANGWTLVITLPRQTLSITDVVGAQVTRDGATWTFVPDQSTAQVRGGTSAQVRFRVDGAPIGATPTSCTVNGRPCDGLAG